MSDPDRRFAETVPVWTEGHIRMIGSAREAAETLLYRWPDGPETRKRRAAREAAQRVAVRDRHIRMRSYGRCEQEKYGKTHEAPRFEMLGKSCPRLCPKMCHSQWRKNGKTQ